MALYQNGSPEHIMLGADDRGSPLLPVVVEGESQHVPLIFTYARKGTTNKMHVGGARAGRVFGVETFSPDSIYYGHATRLAVGLTGAGNTCMIKRLIPTDAGPKSSSVLYMDVLADAVPNYVRTSLGDKVVDGANNFIVDGTTPTIPGTRIKYIVEETTTGALGQLVPKTGTMSNTGGSSTMYPILEHRAAVQGEYYNNLGYSIESLGAANADTAVMAASKALTYNLALVARTDVNSSPQVVRTLFGEPSAAVTFKAGVKHPTSTNRLDISSVFNSAWFNETDPLKTIRYNDYEGMHVYTANMETVLAAIMALEAPHITATASGTPWNDGNTAATIGWFDFTSDVQSVLDTEIHLINPFTGKATTGKDYFTVVIDTGATTLTAGQREVFVSKDAPIYMTGGADGTMSPAGFDALVDIELAKYIDPNSEVIDNAVNVETHMYDTGFGVDTKLNIFNCIAVRKDMNVAVGTHVAGAVPSNLTDTRALAILLKTRAMLFPESDYYGTGVARAVVMGGAMRLYDDIDNVYATLVFELALKSGNMMGAGNGKWDATKAFDHGPNAVLKHGFAYEPKFIPAGVKPALWNDGMVWAQPKDINTYFIPAVQTVYADESSPMNNWKTTCAMATLNRIASKAWREHTGTDSMSDGQFVSVVTEYLNTALDGIFNGALNVVPEVIIDATDAANGFSWHVVFRLESSVTKTKMITSTEVYRTGSLPA